MTTKTLPLEKQIENFHKQIRESLAENDSLKISRLKVGGTRKVLRGIPKFGCELVYTIQDKIIHCTTFHPVSGGMISTFSEDYAKWGLEYLFGIAKIIDASHIIIEQESYDTKNKFLVNAGFQLEHQQGDYSYAQSTKATLDLQNGVVIDAWNLHKVVLRAGVQLRKLQPTTKVDLISKQKLPFKFSFYYKNFKDTFLLTRENEQYCFVYKPYEISMPLQDKNEVFDSMQEFLEEIYEAAKLKIVFKPNKDVFSRFIREAQLSDILKDKQQELFDLLLSQMDPVELDKKLHEKDYEIFQEHRYYQDFELALCRIAEQFYILSPLYEIQVFPQDKKEAAITIFKSLAADHYSKILDRRFAKM